MFEDPHNFPPQPSNQNNVLPNDKFKIIETAPTFAVASVGSYSSESFKIVYNLKFKDPVTRSTVITSGILGSNEGS